MGEMLAEGNWNHRSFTLLGAERLLGQSQGWCAYTLDDTAFLKQGKHSVGVANQYAGCVGHLANCQAVVTAGVAGEHVSSLLAAQLYLPQSWCSPDAAERRAACHVPASVQHRTKSEIALSIVRDVVDWGLPQMPWLCDSAYGENTAFRQALAAMGQTYVVGVSMKLTMWPPGTSFAPRARAQGRGRPPVRLVVDGNQRPMTAVELAMSLPSDVWQQVLWRQGSRGPQQGRFAAVRVRPARGITRNNSYGTVRPEDLQGEQWLLIHWPHGEPEPTKAWLSNLPADTHIVKLVSLARLRWRIERDHEEGKQLLGLGHYEGRTWAGLHHHLALVIIAQQFLALERLRDARELPTATAPSAASMIETTPTPAASPATEVARETAAASPLHQIRPTNTPLCGALAATSSATASVATAAAVSP
jgi:SRSO17 transposase